ncbi:uncharacterized protein LOC127253930 [Andrographis paniculata]|uniref:uncharacterized protein LOC127253930 n=1 Tax=Andrographis paniculata TaxID=175694 RepID=UPI0021E8887C|nr:uncharacterized protein LOC127253930 [Andrographis paniculata]
MDSRPLLHREAKHQMEMNMEEDSDTDGLQRAEEEEEDLQVAANEAAIEDVSEGMYHQEIPPLDDVCPICFDRFTVPCRSNCGHWFCASCILQFWMFRSSMQPCKCPLCCSLIVNLRPESSDLTEPAHDSVEILKKVNQYNGLYISGVLGTFHRMKALPLFIGRILKVLIDPDGLRCIYYIMRLLGLFLALLYEQGEFEFMASGGLGIQRMFDVGASVAVLVLFLIGVGHRGLLRGRRRHFSGPEDWARAHE